MQISEHIIIVLQSTKDRFFGLGRISKTLIGIFEIKVRFVNNNTYLMKTFDLEQELYHYILLLHHYNQFEKH